MSPLCCAAWAARRGARGGRARALSCAVCRSRAGEARLEVSNIAREYSADAARLQLASVRVLDVQPWSGPRRGATVGGVRAVGAPACGVRCAIGDEAAAGGAAAGWRGVGGRGGRGCVGRAVRLARARPALSLIHISEPTRPY